MNFTDDEVVRPRVWASKIWALAPKQWQEMFDLVPQKYKALVRAHLTIFMEHKGVSAKKRKEICDSYLAIPPYPEHDVPVEEDRGKEVIGQGEGVCQSGGDSVQGEVRPDEADGGQVGFDI